MGFFFPPSLPPTNSQECVSLQPLVKIWTSIIKHPSPAATAKWRTVNCTWAQLCTAHCNKLLALLAMEKEEGEEKGAEGGEGGRWTALGRKTRMKTSRRPQRGPLTHANAE